MLVIIAVIFITGTPPLPMPEPLPAKSACASPPSPVIAPTPDPTPSAREIPTNPVVQPNRVMSKSFRLTDNLISEACNNGSIVLWVNRGASKYYLFFHQLDAFLSFIHTNAQSLDDGKVCLDEVCLQDMQKPKLDIDCHKSSFSSVSEDFAEGGHVTMLLAVITAFSSVLTSATGRDVSANDLVCYSSCRKNKISFHLLYPEGHLPLYVCKQLAERTCSRLCKAFASYVNLQIYTKKTLLLTL